MSADLIGDDACREAFNKARQQRFSVHGLDVVCEPDIFRSGYAAGRDSEIAKRDARMAELEKELQAGATAVENCELFRAELAAIKAQEPVAFAFRYDDGSWHDVSSTQHSAGMVSLYAAPVSEAKAQGVVIPPSPYMPGSQPTDFTDYELGEIHGRIAMWEEVKRLNAAPVQQVSVPDDEAVMAKARELFGWAYGLGGFSDAVRDLVAFAAPAAPEADGWISVSERLPLADGQYWCFFSEEHPSTIKQGICIFIERHQQFCDWTVTHWMPPPAAPAAHRAKGVV